MCRYNGRPRILRVGYLHFTYTSLIIRPTLVSPDVAVWHYLETDAVTTFAHSVS